MASRDREKGGNDGAEARKARAAEQLRRNLQRRKAQSRHRAGAATDEKPAADDAGDAGDKG